MSLQFGSNLFYQKLLNETRPRKPAPPPLASLATPQKNTLCSFHFARAGFLFLLMKRVFFCGVLPSKYSGRWRDWPQFDFAKEKRNSPKPPFRFSFAQTERERKQAGKNSFPQPPSLFARLLGLRPQNFWTDGFFGGNMIISTFRNFLLFVRNFQTREH